MPGLELPAESWPVRSDNSSSYSITQPEIIQAKVLF